MNTYEQTQVLVREMARTQSILNEILETLKKVEQNQPNPLDNPFVNHG